MSGSNAPEPSATTDIGQSLFAATGTKKRRAHSQAQSGDSKKQKPNTAPSQPQIKDDPDEDESLRQTSHMLESDRLAATASTDATSAPPIEGTELENLSLIHI